MQNEIIEIARSILGDEVSMETSMESMPAWDSLKTLQIVMALDEAGISLPFEKIIEIRSIRDIVNIMEG